MHSYAVDDELASGLKRKFKAFSEFPTSRLIDYERNVDLLPQWDATSTDFAWSYCPAPEVDDDDDETCFAPHGVLAFILVLITY